MAVGITYLIVFLVVDVWLDCELDDVNDSHREGEG